MQIWKCLTLALLMTLMVGPTHADDSVTLLPLRDGGFLRHFIEKPEFQFIKPLPLKTGTQTVLLTGEDSKSVGAGAKLAVGDANRLQDYVIQRTSTGAFVLKSSWDRGDLYQISDSSLPEFFPSLNQLEAFVSHLYCIKSGGNLFYAGIQGYARSLGDLPGPQNKARRQALGIHHRAQLELISQSQVARKWLGGEQALEQFRAMPNARFAPLTALSEDLAPLKKLPR